MQYRADFFVRKERSQKAADIDPLMPAIEYPAAKMTVSRTAAVFKSELVAKHAAINSPLIKLLDCMFFYLLIHFHNTKTGDGG